jgi:hypothetical protein
MRFASNGQTRKHWAAVAQLRATMDLAQRLDLSGRQAIGSVAAPAL